MANDQSRIREIAWMELFPWLGLVRAVRLAFAPRLLVLAALGLAATSAGWRGIGELFPENDDASWQRSYQSIQAWSKFPVERNHVKDGFGLDLIPGEDTSNRTQATERRTADSTSIVNGSNAPFDVPDVSVAVLDPAKSEAQLPWNMLSEPFRGLFGWETTRTSFLYLLLCGVWAVLVWSIFGAAITRSAALWFAREDRLGLRRSLGWGVVKWPAYCGAAMFPLAGALVVTIAPLLLSFVFSNWNFGLLILALLWPIVLLCGFVLAILLVGFLFGWPLMWPTISSEGTDSFDALSRSYSYAYQRPVHYLFYAAVAGVLGALAWVVVIIFANGVINYSFWAASWGSGVERIDEIQKVIAQSQRLPDQSLTLYWGAKLIGFWSNVVITIAVGFLFSYFWCAATYIYFLLRQAVDATEMDEVAVEEESETYGLPPLQGEPGNVPQVVDAPPEATGMSPPPKE